MVLRGSWGCSDQWSGPRGLLAGWWGLWAAVETLAALGQGRPDPSQSQAEAKLCLLQSYYACLGERRRGRGLLHLTLRDESRGSLRPASTHTESELGWGLLREPGAPALDQLAPGRNTLSWGEAGVTSSIHLTTRFLGIGHAYPLLGRGSPWWF